MPNIKSAKKRVDVTAKKTLENKMVVSRMKTAIKKYNAALSANDFEVAKALLPETVSIINSACSDGVIHKHKASRKVSQLNIDLTKAQAALADSKAKAAESAKASEKAAAEAQAKVDAEAKAAEEAKKPVKKPAAKKAVEEPADAPAKPAAKKSAAKKEDGETPVKKPAAKKAAPKKDAE